MLDPEAVREDFPLLRSDRGSGTIAYLDNASTTQKPRSVIDAMTNFYASGNANVHRGPYTLAREATDRYEGARDTVAAFIGAHSRDEVVFTKNTTEALNLLAHTLAWADAPHGVGRGDRIVVTEMEHHSNLIPWRVLAQRTGADIGYLGITDDARLDLSDLREAIPPETKVVAVTQASNVLGTINPIEPVAARAAEVGALLVVDAAQSAPHVGLDVRSLGADFVAFSGHKMCGPTGIGVLWGRGHLLEALPTFLSGGEMVEWVSKEDMRLSPPPSKFEAGTPPIAQVVGLGAAVEYLQRVGIDSIAARDRELLDHTLDSLSGIPGLRFIGSESRTDRTPVVSFVLDGVDSRTLRTRLDDAGIALRAGHHCAQLACSRFGESSTVRASLYFYNSTSDIDALVNELRELVPRPSPPAGSGDTRTEATMDSEWGAAFADVDTSEVRPYQDVLVPSVFHPWGCLLAGRLAPEEGEDVLDVGTGPGSVARIMASAVGPTGSVVGTDISKAMLTLAAEKPRPDGAPVRYVECGAAPLELPDGVFDVATVQQVLQFVPDRGAALSEMRRVLRRGGRIGVVTWLGLERNPLFNALHSAVAEILGEDAAERFGEPWSVGSDEVVRLVTQAGFGSVSVEEVSLPTAFPGGAEDVCRVYDFSAVRSEVAALEPALQRALRALVGAHLASSTDDTGGIHSHTAASVVLARA